MLKKTKIKIIITGLFILFVVLNLTNFSKEVKNFFYLISSPVQKFFWKTGIKASLFFETIAEIKNLKKENEELKSKIKEILAENVSLKEIKKENEILRNALNIGLEKEFSLVLAMVIGKDISQNYLLINKGEKEGIKKDWPVITPEKILVGKIAEVYENFSKVMLIFNEKHSFDAKIAEKEIYGLIKGKGDFRINLELIPKDKEIKQGDSIVTSAIGGIFPAGILVGEIEEVQKNDIQSFQEAKVKPYFDINHLEFLFIIKK